MNRFSFFFLLIAASLFCHTSAKAQNPVLSQSQLSGNFQVDALYYNPDSSIGAPPVPEKMLMNGFANFNYNTGKFYAGLRFESYLNAIQGFPAGYEGSKIMYRYLGYKADQLEVTVGSIYEQFGNGLVLRAYEERNLGYDNALEGIRVKLEPIKGMYLKGLIGKQRNAFNFGEGIVRGFDCEIQSSELFPAMKFSKTQFSMGGSFVSKYQTDQDPDLILPLNVGAGAGRFAISSGGFNVNAEYAYKINDPSKDNGFIYKHGEALFLSMAYATKGLGLSLTAKRIDNMSFRSERTANLTSLLINYIPAINKQHSYTLMAFYPYASQVVGEMGIVPELFFNLGKKANVTINYSTMNDINKTPSTDTIKKLGYQSDITKLGEKLFFEEFYVDINLKLSKKVKATLAHSYQTYDKFVIQGSGGKIHSAIAVLDLNWRINSKQSTKIEVQHLYTEQDDKSWAMGSIEYRIASKWNLAVIDLYNYGNDILEKRIHYYNFAFGYVKNANRISLGYGKQRAGIFCVGGVCRNVPASNGLALTITSSF